MFVSSFEWETCHGSHASSTVKKHVLVCDEHKKDVINKSLLEEYRSRCITRNGNNDLSKFAKTIRLPFLSNMSLPKEVYSSNHEVQVESGIYMFQQIMVNEKKFMLFFDSGCGDLHMMQLRG